MINECENVLSRVISVVLVFKIEVHCLAHNIHMGYSGIPYYTIQRMYYSVHIFSIYLITKKKISIQNEVIKNENITIAKKKGRFTNHFIKIMNFQMNRK